jgi:hypothetical protein
MNTLRFARFLWIEMLVLGVLVSCDRGQGQGSGAPAGQAAARKGVAEVEGGADLKGVAGQTIYVPVYSQIPIGDKGHPFALSVTLSVRNTDRAQPIVVTAVRYYDQDGQLAREFLTKPLRVAPMAALEYFVQERDSSGGSSASFLVEWVAEQQVSKPAVEAVMAGTAGNQGISFTTSGRVVAEKNP